MCAARPPLKARPPRPQPRFFESLINYFRGWRYDAAGVLVCFAAMYFGWLMLADPLFLTLRLRDAASSLCAATSLVLAIFLINDAADRDIDALVHPDRPIPRGTADWRHVYGFGVALLALSITLAALLGTRYLIAIAATVVLVLIYYTSLKRHSPIPCASELIAPLISAMFPFTAFALAPNPRIDIALTIASFIYFADMAQDLLGGIHDESGDRRCNVRTFAVTIGADATSKLSAIAFALSLLSGAALWWLAGLGWIYAITFIALSLAMLREYLAVLTADADLRARASRANHLGGVYYFVVSASLLPDELLRRSLA
jgi:4-hydroxybenzoate polyprenyltransferase